MDEALREIYTRETGAHVSTIRHYLKREALSAEPHLLPEDVYRACHTLAGSSKMAQARHGVRLAEPLDHWLRRAFTSGIGLRSADLTLLADSMGAMESVAAHLDEPTGYFVNHWQLLERLGEAERALDARIAEASRAGSSRAEERPEATPGPRGPDGVLPSEQAAPEAQPEAVAEEPPDFDPEVAAIFTEEALELIDASEHALSDWRDKPGSPESATALKRPLHTLKGGARMAGIMAMGDLSHELETLVIQAENGTVAIDGAAFDVIQASLDELARMRESVANGRRVLPARTMIARIQALTRPGGASGAAPAAAEAPPTQAAAAPVTAPAVAAEPIEPRAPPPMAAIAQPEPAEEVAADSLTGENVELVTEMPEPPMLAAPAEPDTPPLEETQRPPVLSSAPPPAAQEPEPAAPQAPLPQISVAETPADDVLAAPQPVPPGREPVAPVERQEMARVDAELLDKLLNISGEASISRSRLEQQLGSIDFNLGELSRTVTRLKDQLRSLEIETEAQILHRHEDEGGHRSEFDPLELDRYSSIQQFSRALAETANDVASIQQLLENLAKDAQNLLQQQARTITELQNGLMRTRMVPFQRHVQRLARIVRQAASDTGKRAELVVEGASGELDRQVLERMLPPFEHMLRNAVVHGIEAPEERTRRGKPPAGRILLELHREGAEVMVRLTDDGGGMNLEAIRAKGRTLGLIPAGRALSDEDAMQLILEPGFSTAGALTQQAGRGVGMDVVATEIKRLGGALHMETKAGEGSVFTIKLPFTLAISHALVVRTGEEFYALPLPTVEGVLRLSKAEVSAHLGRDASLFDYGGQKYRFQHLAAFVGLEPSPLPEQDVTIPVVLVRAGEHSTGLVADELVGSREIVVKSVGPQISGIRGISGATILGDGRIVIILDIGALVRAEWRGRGQLPAVSREKEDRRTFALVVDDSITVRRVTQRLLERNGMRVLTARDGMDAVALLQDHVPDIILLDIEMPRMDGYEVASHVRNDPRIKDVPIIMITSRVGEKHRARAIELGVDDYLGKPYQEAELLDAITPLVERRRAAQDSALQDVPMQAEGR
jgi:chemosensory pili system protein ChpA (sensor histidine kinase/response regulator)